MEDSIGQRLTDRYLWLRVLFMVLFAIAYSIAELVITIVVVLQFLVVLFSGRANDNLLTLGSNLSAYVYQILQFETFNTEARPYPFSSWPNEAAGGSHWTDKQPPEPPTRTSATTEEDAGEAAEEPARSEEPPADEPEDRPERPS